MPIVTASGIGGWMVRGRFALKTAATQWAAQWTWPTLSASSTNSAFTIATSATTSQTIWLGGAADDVLLTYGTRHAPDRAAREWLRQARDADRAGAKARRLLLENVSEAQRQSLEAHGYFDVPVNGRTYRIHQGTHGNVRRLENGVETVSLCAQPLGVPACDAMLAQKLMLETDEAAFLRIANARALAPR